ncbi:MAG: UvrD-helicase domain-containing protein, partial [Acidaminococcaceae bacterium]|nr:UvrD-helicase domain-containing protein [Acidaminococcaceae bacterium]
MNNTSVFENLNKEQLDAVQATKGPMLIIAGAGSGKTRVLTCRVAHLLNQGVEPWRILAITFTNKAAKEMRERVDKMSGYSAQKVNLYTFHSFCSRILRQEIEVLDGYNRNFAIYDANDQKSLIKQILKDLNLTLLNEESIKKYVKRVSSAISIKKNIFPFEDISSLSFSDKDIPYIYDEYQKRLHNNNALDFDDLLLVMVNLFNTHPEILAKYQQRYQYIMVDEYQDTNKVQYLLTKQLAADHHNICVVGDEDQSIYGWRGADIHNILDFEKDYPEAKIVKLEQNYRSTPNILNVANALIANNTEHKLKKLWTDNKSGEIVYHYEAIDAQDEAYFVTEQILSLKEKMKLGDIAILYRTNFQSRVLEEMCIKKGIPYIIVGGTRFYERKEIKDALAYLYVIANPYDSLNLMRIINVPKRGIGETTLNKLNTYANDNNLHLFDVLSNAQDVPNLSAGIQQKLENFSALIFELVNQAANKNSRELLDAILTKTGMLAELENSSDTQEQGSRAENLKEFLSVAEDFATTGEEDTLTNFLEHIALVSDIDTAKMQGDAINLMTLHSAKGLEFKTVFITGMNQGTFPSANKGANIEEERRLCYVGITRAKKFLFLSDFIKKWDFDKNDYIPTDPSQFLAEIPPELIQEFRKKQTTKPIELATPRTFAKKKQAAAFSNTPAWAKKILPASNAEISNVSTNLSITSADGCTRPSKTLPRVVRFTS